MSAMTVPASPLLLGRDGELVLIRIPVDSRHLEDLLEALAAVPFPINPEIRHGSPMTTVQFPAYSGYLGEVRKVLEEAGLGESRIEIASMLAAIS